MYHLKFQYSAENLDVAESRIRDVDIDLMARTPAAALNIRQRIADYHQVAIMVSPQAMSVERFFERNDPDKVFIKEQIMQAEDPEKTMANYRECIARVNSKEHYDEYVQSGFYTLARKDVEKDTKAETLKMLAKHFGLTAEESIY